MRFNAWSFGRAWNSVALAQGNDKSRPALFHSTLIEMFPDGVRLVSTDSYILLKAWVATADWPDAPEPGHDEMPDEVAICSDVDGQIVQLMKYAQSKTKQDGDDTDVVIEMQLGAKRPTDQGTLEGMTQTSVTFRLDHSYDQSIESPVYDGAFPNWRPLWFSHRWTQTGLVTFGADGILRLGKLSQLWDRAAIRFELGGTSGVSKVHIQAPGVNVSGLAMPVRESRVDYSEPAMITEVPPSVEGIDHEYGEALDDFLADILKTESGSGTGDDVIASAQRTQLVRAGRVLVDEGFVSAELLVDAMNITTARAEQLIAELAGAGVILNVDPDGEVVDYWLVDEAKEMLDALEAAGEPDEDIDVDEQGGEPV